MFLGLNMCIACYDIVGKQVLYHLLALFAIERVESISDSVLPQKLVLDALSGLAS